MLSEGSIVSVAIASMSLEEEIAKFRALRFFIFMPELLMAKPVNGTKRYQEWGTCTTRFFQR